MSSKVTFENLITQNSIPSSPKTKDQSVMAQMDHKGRSNNTTSTTTTTLTSEQTQDGNENKNGRMPLASEGTITSGSTSAKSSVKELVGNQKAPNHRKSKSQNRARKALRTITFILGIHPFSPSFLIHSFSSSRRICRLLDSMVRNLFNHWIDLSKWHHFRHIYSAIHSLCESCQKNWIFTNPMFHCFYFLCYLNSPINPFCYALANQQFKKTFTRILRLDLRRLWTLENKTNKEWMNDFFLFLLFWLFFSSIIKSFFLHVKTFFFNCKFLPDISYFIFISSCSCEPFFAQQC